MHLTSNVDKYINHKFHINIKYILTKYDAFNLVNPFKCVPVTSLDFFQQDKLHAFLQKSLVWYGICFFTIP